MPKMKTKKSISKRLKLTGGGKLMRRKAGGLHLLVGKSSARKRRVDGEAELSTADTARLMKGVPYAQYLR